MTNNAIEIIQKHGFTVKDLTGTEADLEDGIDILVSDGKNVKRVDYKAQTTNNKTWYYKTKSGEYTRDCNEIVIKDNGEVERRPNTPIRTALLSLEHVSRKTGKWVLPKYLQNDDIFVWFIDVNTKIIWEITPAQYRDPSFYIDTIIKINNDKFGNQHILGVVDLDKCRIILPDHLVPRF